MHSFKIVPNQPQTREEQERRLKEIKEQAKKSEIKFLNAESLNNESKVAHDKALVGSNEPGSIVIPDIYTAFGYSGVAASITNNCDGPINYGYTYDGTQKGYYKYTIENGDTTGNGMGADSYTHHCMIIEIPINDGSGNSGFFVPCVVRYDFKFTEASLTVPTISVYYVMAKSDHPPKFSDKVGSLAIREMGPDPQSLDLALNLHVKFELKRNGFYGPD